MIAQVIINSMVKSLNKTFDYNIPENLENQVQIGSRVEIPFGNKKTPEEGFVIDIKESTTYKVKDIIKVQENILTKEDINLAKWMAKRYFCNLSDGIKLMLPPGTTTKNVESRVKEKNVQVILLKKEDQEIEQLILKEKIKSPKQIRALEFLMENEEVTISDIEVFADVSRAVIKTLQKNGFVEIIEKQVIRDPFSHKQIENNKPLALNKEQQKAFDEVKEKLDKNEYQEFLLYGITGSGKTEVYMQLIESALSQGKTSIVLVPEISLTPQMVDRFIARFGQEKIAALHSKLSVGERYDSWKKIKEGEAKIVIGARSAIFAPMQNLGLIIIDEEHDSSYKSEMNPRYHAIEVAKKIAEEKNIPLLLGSATPDIPNFYKARQGEIRLLTLEKRANSSTLPEVEIVDLREELANGNRSMISRKLYNMMQENLKAKKQTILFLNRRGFSTFIMCRDCGYTLNCKNCNISMTYHKKDNRLKCHYCGHEEQAVTICPECGSKKIRYFGTGTQKLEEEVKKLFPEATTIRMDVDTVTKKNSHEMILNQFKEESIDILIGTQMVVKGHHFPKVTLVGVIAADSSLHIDDYRSSERTFDLIVQVAGRAGREELPGKVIVQTYNPDDFSIQCAKEQNYDSFYEAEINIRRQLKYPPFCDIIVFGLSGLVKAEVQKASNTLYQILDEQIKQEKMDTLLLKPLPCPIDRIKNRYRFRMILKGKADEEMITMINQAMTKYYKENFRQTRMMIDINPTNMM